LGVPSRPPERAGQLPAGRDFGFVVALAERALEAAAAFRVRESQRSQRRRVREATLEARMARKRDRAREAEAREKKRRMRLRLKAEKGMTMEEILRGDP